MTALPREWCLSTAYRGGGSSVLRKRKRRVPEQNLSRLRSG